MFINAHPFEFRTHNIFSTKKMLFLPLDELFFEKGLVDNCYFDNLISMKFQPRDNFYFSWSHGFIKTTQKEFSFVSSSNLIRFFINEFG